MNMEVGLGFGSGLVMQACFQQRAGQSILQHISGVMRVTSIMVAACHAVVPAGQKQSF